MISQTTTVTKKMHDLLNIHTDKCQKILLSLLAFVLSLFYFNTTSAQNLYDKYDVNWYQYGFKIGTCFTQTHDISYNNAENEYSLAGLFCGEFGVYFRAGKYIFGEIGLGYQFQKTKFTSIYAEGIDVVELRYLQIPIKAVGYLPVGKLVALNAHLGVIYQPLIKVTDNFIGLSKQNIHRHECQFTTGLGVKIHFITVDFSYRKSFFSYFSDRKSSKEGYLNLQIGIQL